MTTRETQHELYQALNAHTSNLEIIRSIAFGRDLEALDRRIDASRLLLEWIEQALELERPASRAVQESPSLTIAAGFSPVDPRLWRHADRSGRFIGEDTPAIPVGPTPQAKGVSALRDRLHEFDPPCAWVDLSSDP